MVIITREATPEDAEAIASVHIASWRVAYRDLIPKSYLDVLSQEAKAQDWKTDFIPQ